MTAPSSPLQWTESQRAAIESRGTELIVSAAAGSGKTAVLAERVLQIITVAEPPAAEPVKLEELLVITFTRKAAREMRDRIERKIREGLAAAPGSEPLRAALDVLPRANIMTLDAFCDRLVRRHFHRAKISPDARIAEDGEEREVADSAAAQVFEELSALREEDASADGRGMAEDFATLLTATPRERENETHTLRTRVHKIRAFIASLDNPEKWVNAARAKFDAILAARDFSRLPHLQSVAREMSVGMRDLAELLSATEAEARARRGGEEILNGWLGHIARMAAFADGFDHTPPEGLAAVTGEFAEWLDINSHTLEKLQDKGVCGGTLCVDKPFVDGVLKKVGTEFKRFRERWFALDTDQVMGAEKLAARQGRALLDLALRVEDRAQEIKRRRGVLGFADMARKALVLLTDPESGGPSEISEECRALFKHVLVDEYQDISPLQDAIIRRLSHADDLYQAGERNLFMVGDIKQSVYRFRRAEPALFARRLDEHGGADPALARVNLRENFRSRPGILDAVNALCARVMDRAVGGVEYDDSARLHPFRADAGYDPVCVEACWLLVPDAEEDTPDDKNTGTDSDESGENAPQNLSGVEREAEWIARRILNLTHPLTGMKIPDHDSGTPRPLRPGDCAILVRNLSKDSGVWVRTLARHGLRVRGMGDDRGTVTLEESDLFSALRLADNPLDDYALVAALRSPMFAMSEDDMLRIRMLCGDGPFHQAFWIAAGRGWASDADGENESARHVLPENLSARISVIAARIEEWRIAAERDGVEGVLDIILNSTGYESHAAGLPGAPERLAAVRDIRAALRSHAARGGASLGEFLRLHAQASGKSPTLGDEEEPGGEANIVRLMTVHKSKGLEFPVVFFARLASPFNTTDSRSGMQLSAGGGLAVEAIDTARRIRMKPPGLLAMQDEEARQIRAEELRLIYVAMTRARERLILVGSSHQWKSEGGMREKWRHRPMALGDVAPAAARLRARSAADLIAPSFLSLAESVNPPPWLSFGFDTAMRVDDTVIPLPGILEWAIRGDDEGSARRTSAIAEFTEVFQADPRATNGLGLRAHSGGPAAFAPPPLILPSDHRPGLSRAPAKVFASTLRRNPRGAWMLADTKESVPVEQTEWDVFAEDDRTPPAPLIRTAGMTILEPAFIRSRARARLDPAAIGTHTHALLRHLDLRGLLDENGLRAQAAGLRARGLLELDSDDHLDELPLADVAWFFTTSLGRLMTERPGSVSRELPFRRWIHASEIHESAPDGSTHPLGGPDDDGRILVQGVVDCVIDAGSEAIILDYKTDHARTRREVDDLAARYHAQIDAYRSALRAIWRTGINETALVFLRARQIVTVPDPTV